MSCPDDATDELPPERARERAYRAEILRLQTRVRTLNARVKELEQNISELHKGKEESDKALHRAEENEERFLELIATEADLRQEIESLKAGGPKHLEDVGISVRVRFLEKHRQRMDPSRWITTVGVERVKKGDREAHRGRPVVDALVTDTVAGLKNVYEDLYGVSPEWMQEHSEDKEIEEIVGFRASLITEGELSDDFEATFKRALESFGQVGAAGYAFLDNYAKLQTMYDTIINQQRRRPAKI